MTNDPAALRRYLLGSGSDEERAAITDEYFGDAAALTRVEDAEDDLIDAYLESRLTTDERHSFERHYLASPTHRTRVDVARHLRAAAPFEREARHRWPLAVRFAAAAVLTLAAAGAVWMLSGRWRLAPSSPSVATQAEPPAAVPDPAAPPATPAPAPVVVALSVPPVAVRGSGGPPAIVIPGHADVLLLQLELEPGQPFGGDVRAVIRTIDGDAAVWRGPAEAPTSGRASARVSVPTRLLTPGDYLAALFDRDAAGRERERGQYFFRVRPPPHE